jgi:hypothetical protein|nr:MAG TPA: hypothetical protein [Caudoviricetes sp.]
MNISNKDTKDAISDIGLGRFMELVILLGNRKSVLYNGLDSLIEGVTKTYKRIKEIRDECSS